MKKNGCIQGLGPHKIAVIFIWGTPLKPAFFVMTLVWVDKLVCMEVAWAIPQIGYVYSMVAPAGKI